MIAVFIACLAIPELFHEVPGGWSAAATMVGCYAVVRCAHVGFYLLAARHDPSLRRQVLITIVGSLIPTIALLTAGVVIGDPYQLWIWLAAVLYDFAAVFVTAVRGTGWRIQSAAHFAERHGLIVILALGESIVAVGTGLAGEPIDRRIALAAFLSLMVSLGLWFAYFRRVAPTVEHALEHVTGRGQAGTARPGRLHLTSTSRSSQGSCSPLWVSSRPWPTWTKTTSARSAAGHSAAGLSCSWPGRSRPWRSSRDWMPLRIGFIVALVALSPLLSAALPLVSVGIVGPVMLTLAAVESIIGRRADG